MPSMSFAVASSPSVPQSPMSPAPTRTGSPEAGLGPAVLAEADGLSPGGLSLAVGPDGETATPDADVSGDVAADPPGPPSLSPRDKPSRRTNVATKTKTSSPRSRARVPRRSILKA